MCLCHQIKQPFCLSYLHLPVLLPLLWDLTDDFVIVLPNVTSDPASGDN